MTLPTPAQSLLQGIEATREIMDQLRACITPQEMWGFMQYCRNEAQQNFQEE